jgi:hypothetical protein
LSPFRLANELGKDVDVDQGKALNAGRSVARVRGDQLLQRKYTGVKDEAEGVFWFNRAQFKSGEYYEP